MKNIFLIISVIFLIGCEQPYCPLESYIQNPSKRDTTCISDINKAKMMVKNGEIVFSYPFSFGSWELRQEKQLKKLCEQYNLIFDYELIGCVNIEGQRQGCFGAYMDKIIADKFGTDFKEKLLAQADSMMLVENDTVPYYLCDERPEIFNIHNDNKSEYFVARVPENLRKQLKTNNDGKYPFMDIGFYIDKEGSVSGFFLNNFVSYDESNQEFKDELFNIAIEHIQRDIWKSGIVNGQRVITENNVRVFF